MAVVSSSIHIGVAADTVFAYLIDVERHVEWSGRLSFGLERVEKVTPGPLRAGSVFKSMSRLSSRSGAEDASTVAVIEPARRLAWETVSSGPQWRNTFRWAYTLEPEDNGTRLTYTLEARRFSPKPLRLWFPPLLWLVDRQIFGREMAGGLQRIKGALEG